MKEITVSELLDYHVNLEKELLRILDQKIQDFQHETGVGISNIHLSFMDVGTVSKPERQRILSRVSVYLELEEMNKEDE